MVSSCCSPAGSDHRQRTIDKPRQETQKLDSKTGLRKAVFPLYIPPLCVVSPSKSPAVTGELKPRRDVAAIISFGRGVGVGATSLTRLAQRKYQFYYIHVSLEEL